MALNNQQWLTCHKTKPNEKFIFILNENYFDILIDLILTEFQPISGYFMLGGSGIAFIAVSLVIFCCYCFLHTVLSNTNIIETDHFDKKMEHWQVRPLQVRGDLLWSCECMSLCEPLIDRSFWWICLSGFPYPRCVVRPMEKLGKSRFGLLLILAWSEDNQLYQCY